MSGQLKEVRERISSVKSTQKITSAMKMVSAAKLRKAQDAITEMRPYAERLKKMLVNILTNLGSDANTTFANIRVVEKVAIVVVTSNRGLCGAFNSNIVKEALKLLEKHQKKVDKGNVDLIFVGKKGFDGLKNKSQGCNYNLDYMNLYTDLSFENTSTGAQFLMEQFAGDNYDRIYICYGRFKNAAVQFSTVEQFLPVEDKKIKGIEKPKKTLKADYIFEPGKEELLEELIPTILQTTFHKCLLDTNASEHGARMTAMDKATENAGEMIKELKINYNKARQAAITTEISEIVSGAAALEG